MWIILSFVLFLCSCNTTKILQEQIVTTPDIFESEKDIVPVQKDPVPYQDYLADLPVYEMQIAKQDPTEKIKIWDPIEPVNRAVFHFNDFVIDWVIYPIGEVYSFIIPRLVQKRISNVNDNISMPRKFTNNVLQFKIAEASSVLSRFLLNTTVGIGGIFDFADYTGAGFLKRPPDQTLAKTFAHWGIPPGPYIVIPFLGPSDLRGGVGQIGDLPLSVFTYYLPEVGYVLRANDIVYFLPLYYQATDALDPYANLRDFSRLQSRGKIALEEHDAAKDKQSPPTPEDIGILETLQFLQYSASYDEDFAQQAATGTIKYKGEENPINYNLWMQEKEAPLVVVIPGFGGDYDTSLCLKTAEEFYGKNFSVLTTSSTFSEDFANGFKNGKPGNIIRDTENIYLMIKAILSIVKKEYPGKISSVSLVGYSMGGFYTSFIAAKEEKLAQPIFSSYVSVHSPGNLTYALSTIDKCLYESYKDLDQETRGQRQLKSIGTIFQKVNGSGANPWDDPYEITGEDARFLIGFSYIRSLMIWVDDQPIGSFSSYCRNLLIPQYQKKANLDKGNIIEIFGYNNSYWKIQKTLQNNNKLHLFVNANDPLLDKNSLELVKKIVPESRLHLSPNGGHLGNLDKMQPQIIETIKNHK